MTRDHQNHCSIRLKSLVAVICFNVFLSIFFATGKFSKPQALFFGLEDRINPNAATSASLVRLPGIGRAKAEAIVSYRKKTSSSGWDAKVFKDAADLDDVSGIGPKTTKGMQKFLKFE